MADETQAIKGIKWRETFEWTHLFRAFRVAIHPSKLILGLLALLSIYLGGRALDYVWPASSSAVPNELTAYARWTRASMGDVAPKPFSQTRQDHMEQVQSAYARLLMKHDVASNRDAARDLSEKGASLGELKDAIIKHRDETVKAASERRDKADEEASKITDDRERDKKKDEIRRGWESAVKIAFAEASQDLKSAGLIKGHGLFINLFEWQVTQFEVIINTMANGQIIGPMGAIQAIWDFSTVGPCWLLTQHPIYFLLFGVWFLLMWSLFGGAIARIAALHVARDEKPSVPMALKFSTSKLISFFSAPLIPLAAIVIIGLVIAAGGFIGNIPGIGPIIVGALFILALAAAFAITLLLLGLIGGFNMVYPAIAVEGTDSFDALARSYNFVLKHPWRLSFYTLISLAYGSICYLFVRFFIFVMLSVAHAFAGWWFFARASSTNPLWTTIWPKPQLGDFSFHPDFSALGPMQSAGAWLMAFWIYIAISLLGAFAISFYFSANTLIYTLLRRNVDNTELDAVYIEPMEEEFTEASPPTPIATPVASQAPAPVPAPAAPVEPPASPEPAPAPEPPAPPAGEQSNPGENPPPAQS